MEQNKWRTNPENPELCTSDGVSQLRNSGGTCLHRARSHNHDQTFAKPMSSLMPSIKPQRRARPQSSHRPGMIRKAISRPGSSMSGEAGLNADKRQRRQVCKHSLFGVARPTVETPRDSAGVGLQQIRRARRSWDNKPINHANGRSGNNASVRSRSNFKHDPESHMPLSHTKPNSA